MLLGTNVGLGFLVSFGYLPVITKLVLVSIYYGCKGHMDSYMAPSGSMLYGHLDYFQKPPRGGRPNIKPLGDHGTPNAHNRWFILFYPV
jgi:hypothetical protein